MSDVLFEDRGGVRRLVLNRPEKRNALSHGLIEALLAQFRCAERDASVKVLVLVGAGLGFSAGADLAEARQAADEAAIRHHAELMAQLLFAPARLRKPVVAQLHGFAFGAGLGLALACDIAFCADDATLAFPETRHGMVPALVAPSLLRRVGQARAFELLATGRPIPVARAAELGLVRATASEALEGESDAFAAEIAAVPDPIIPSLKALLQDADGQPLPAAMAMARDVNIAGKLRALAGARG